MFKGIQFHVHVQLTDTFGKTYFDWTVYRTFPEFFDLHKNTVCLPIVDFKPP